MPSEAFIVYDATHGDRCASIQDSVNTVEAVSEQSHLMPMSHPNPIQKSGRDLVQEWTVPGEATLGSSVRAKGILLEIRSKLPFGIRRQLELETGVLVLRVGVDFVSEFSAAAATISQSLVGIQSLPVIPRELEDILAITRTERHRWLKDGRLPSAGTRTVKLRGRARKITFHVFDPRQVEDLLDGELIATWRETDAQTAAENRRRAAWNRRLSRSQKASGQTHASADTTGAPNLVGWEEFERNGPLR